MDEQGLIQVNFQLPASALDSLSKLAEQLRKLAAAVSGQPAGMAEEVVESGTFDQERFQALVQKSRAVAEWTLQAEARSARPDTAAQIQEPESAGRVLPEGPQEPVQAEPPADLAAERPETAGLEPDDLKERAAEDIPAVRPELEEQTPDAPVVQMEPESLIPEAEKAWAGTEEGELPLPAAQAVDLTGVETPLGAGLVVTTQPEPPVSRWTDVTEELVTPGPAPLTAEAVSLAFQRDGRRYDNGFPLY